MNTVIDALDKRELIKQNIMLQLRAITKEGGYSIDVNFLSDNLKHWEEIDTSDFPALFVISGDETYNYSTNRTIDSIMMPIIVGYVKSEDQSDTQLNALIRAVRKALLGTNKTQDTNAFITYIDRVSTDKGTMRPFAVFEMNCRVQYRDTSIL